MQIQKFQRKPFSVDGVKVTDDNLDAVAAWCLGEVVVNPKTSKKHIRVDAHRPLTERQTMALPGDWVLFYNRGYKVYTETAFSRNFELIEAGTGKEESEFVPVPTKPVVSHLESDTPLELNYEDTSDVRTIDELARDMHGIYPPVEALKDK